MEWKIILQRYSDKFRTEGKMLYKSFKRRIYSAQLRKLTKQRKKIEQKIQARKILRAKMFFEEVDYFREKVSLTELKEQLNCVEKKEDKIRGKIEENC